MIHLRMRHVALVLLLLSVPALSLALWSGVRPNPLNRPWATPNRPPHELAKRGVAAARMGAIGVYRNRPRFKPNEYLVRFAPDVSRSQRMALHRRAGARLIGEIPQLDIHTIRVPGPAAAALYENYPGVQYIERNHMRYPLVADPNDPAYRNLDWDMPFDPEETPPTWFEWDAHLIDAVGGWSLWPATYFTASGKGALAVKVAVIDTGIDATHPDFINAGGTGTSVSQGGQLLNSLSCSIIAGTVTLGNTDAGARDHMGHGTHVSGILAASTNNNRGVTGNGYNANLFMIRILDAAGNGTVADLTKAILYAADNGAVVCNISLGDYNYSQAEQDAINYAWDKGMLIVAGAGNEGYADPLKPVYPGSCSRVLTVSATERNDALASYSSFGEQVGLCAPGGDIDYEFLVILGVYSTLPTYEVTMTAPPYGPRGEGSHLNYDYSYGTSMATPQVAGAAALYAGMKGYQTATPGAPKEIFQALQRSVYGVPTWEMHGGWGRLDLYQLANIDADPNPRGDTGGCITGQVRYRGTPVDFADVTAQRIGTGDTFAISTRAAGMYRIANIPAGTYNVTATYFGESRTIAGVVVDAGCDTPGIDFDISAGAGPGIFSVTVSPLTVAGSLSAKGKVTLTENAPAGGVEVALSSSKPDVAWPALETITIAAGTKAKSFTIKTAAVSATTSVTISATTGTSTRSATLTVRRIGVKKVVVAPSPVAGSLPATGTVTLEAPAAPGPITVTLSSNKPGVAKPAVSSLVVPAGSVTGGFGVNTFAVSASTTVSITAKANAISKSFALTVRRIGVGALGLSPNPVVGGNPVTGTITLEAPAPAGGVTANITSSNGAIAAPTVGSVFFPAGETTRTFTINTAAVLASGTSTIKAAANGVSKSKVLTVNPP